MKGQVHRFQLGELDPVGQIETPLGVDDRMPSRWAVDLETGAEYFIVHRPEILELRKERSKAMKKSFPPAEAVELGGVPNSWSSRAPYTWAKRVCNWWGPDGRSDVLLQVSRSENSEHVDSGGVSIGIFIGEDNDIEEPGAQLSEDEFRELLVAAGCRWAKP